MATGKNAAVGIDFDKKWKGEQGESEPITFRVGGHDFTVPGEPPAAVFMRMWTRDSSGKLNPTPEEALSALEDRLGAEQYARLLSTGIRLPRLMEVQTWILDRYNGMNEARESAKQGE